MEPFHQVLKAQSPQCMTKSSEAHKSQLQVNWGLGDGEMVWDTSFMSQRGSFFMSSVYIEDFEARSKVSKNGKWLVISSFQKWQVFGSYSTWLSNIKETSNEILVNMKVEYISLPSPKSPRTCNFHLWLTRYGQINFRKCPNSKWHNSHMEWPNWLVLLWANHIWYVLS